MTRGSWPLAWGTGICKAKPKNTDPSPQSRSSGGRTAPGENRGPCHGSSAVTLPQPPSDRIPHRRTPAPRKVHHELVYTYSLC